MTIPVHLPQHRAEGAHEEEDPLVGVHAILLAITRAEFVVGVIDTQEVVEHGAGLPACDGGVGVFESGDPTIWIESQESQAFDAVGGVAKFPEFDGVGYVEEFKGYGDFVRVGACVMCVED